MKKEPFWGLIFDLVDFPLGTLAVKVPVKTIKFGDGKDLPARFQSKRSKVIVVGYFNDYENEAFLVILEEELWRFRIGSPYAVILVSSAEDAKAFDERCAKFEILPREEQFEIEGGFGYFDGTKYRFCRKEVADE